MNKNVGATVGAVALAAVLLRPTGSISTPHEQAEAHAAVGQHAGKKSAGDGPWAASCEYWEARSGKEPVSEEEAAFSVTLDEKNHQLSGSFPTDTAEESKPECGSDSPARWGISPAGSNSNIEIKSIIAVVPDPVRTNMALQFDRSIDALVDAAGEYGYVSSYYWLPWKEQDVGSKAAEGEGRSNAAKSVHEPGLIIFKCAQPAQGCSQDASGKTVSSSTPRNDYARVVYLFLVGETATTGIDGFQIHQAFAYQDELESALTGTGAILRRSTEDDLSSAAIIGPIFSGSAASLRQAIDTMLAKHLQIKSVHVDGATSTGLAVDQLNSSPAATNPAVAATNDDASQKIEYNSFAYDGAYAQRCFLNLLSNTSTDPTQVAYLVEDGTAFATAAINQNSPNKPTDKVKPTQPDGDRDPCLKDLRPSQVLRFPREISLLRNAQAEQGIGQGQKESESAPSPYLHFSLKDSNAYDTVPHLSRDNTPLSQEAQLMTIARFLQRYHVRYIAISGSNVLDLLFLAQFLHRACPDARLLFYVGDLLFEREIDNVPFIGTITFTPYPLISPSSSDPGGPRRAFSDSNTEAYYNAASYIFWGGPKKIQENGPCDLPKLAGYRNILQTPDGKLLYPPLWVTAIGGDGYYPIGIASPHANSNTNILPQIQIPPPCQSKPDTSKKTSSDRDKKPSSALPMLRISPERLWYFFCVIVFCLAACHLLMMSIANYWSPFTRELAVTQNDQPRRRAMYIHIGTVMLFCMAFVITVPALAMSSLFQASAALSASFEVDSLALICSGFTLLVSGGAVILTFYKTWDYIWPGSPKGLDLDDFRQTYFIFNLVAWITLLALPSLWFYLCNVGNSATKVGLFFSYRCVHPGSGVSPVVPVLILLFSWYLWAVFQTMRLRFSKYGRPRLPGRLDHGAPNPLFIADEDLSECYEDMWCLMILRRILRRFLKGLLGKDVVFVLAYLLALILFVYFAPVRSLDAFFWVTNGRPTWYQLLVTILFFPLLFIVITNWLRMIVAWIDLKRDLLERLENLPIRFAFSRLKTTGRLTMMRQSGLREQWRDMARSTESMRQMANCPDCIRTPQVTAPSPSARKDPHVDLTSVNTSGPKPSRLESIDQALDLWALLEQKRSGNSQPNSVPPSTDQTAKGETTASSPDFPHGGDGEHLGFIFAMQSYYAQFGEILLEYLLLPYWKRTGCRPVASSEKGALSDDTPCIRIAEEFLAIRYLSLIRAVLSNLLQLMVFVSVSFVLAIVAWNSYPFQPRVFINWVFTGMLAVLGCGVIWVLAQLHRDPILSRITRTKANELGLEFYIRIVAFGAVPVLTWLAYQFPEVGSTIFKFLQPGLEVVK